MVQAGCFVQAGNFALAFATDTHTNLCDCYGLLKHFVLRVRATPVLSTDYQRALLQRGLH
jgi:hypothetical protein